MTTRRRTTLWLAAFAVLANAACSGVDATTLQRGFESGGAARFGDPAAETLGANDAPTTEPCLPELDPAGAWLAADGGRSVPLPNGTAIHLFGDTLIGPVDAADERDVTFVGNSIGLAACDQGQFTIDYLWRANGSHRGAFFDLGDPEARLWPVDGFYVDDRLHVVLGKIVETTEGMGFGYAGAVIANVENPLDAPLAWNIEYRALSNTEGVRPGKGVTVHDGHAYLYSALDVGEYPQPATLLRVPLSELDAPETHVEYLSANDGWRPSDAFTTDDAFVVLPAAPPNMNVSYHEGLGQWITVQGDVPPNSSSVVFRTADALEGPWSSGTKLFDFPEMLEEREDGSRVGCYAVTEHPQHRLDDGNILVVTYACNKFDSVVPMVDDLDFYYPKTVTVDLGIDELRGGETLTIR